jgi:hypothetical protein
MESWSCNLGKFITKLKDSAKVEMQDAALRRFPGTDLWCPRPVPAP